MKSESTGRAMRIIEGAIAAVVFILMGLLFFRLWLHSNYPKDVSRMIPTDDLRAAYEAGELQVKTQKLYVEYDDPNEGLFFADCLTFDEGAGDVQIAIRYNKSTLTKLAERYGAVFDPAAAEPFSYRIFCCTGGEGDDLIGRTYTPSEWRDASRAMYRYRRLAFSGVDLTGVNWIRIEIVIEGVEEPVALIAIYDGSEQHYKFTEYELKGNEFS
jgi:hypothetical protein